MIFSNILIQLFDVYVYLSLQWVEVVMLIERIELETVRYHLKQLQHGGPDGELPGLVRILTPDRQQYRLYGLTEIGREVVEFL